MTVRFNTPRAAAFDANGNPRSGAKLFFYEPSTFTPKDVYSEPTLTTPIAQPVVATSAGLWATIYMDPSLYRVVCLDANNVTLWDEDTFDPGLPAGFGVSSVVGVAQGGTGAATAAAARSNLGAASSEAVTIVQDTVSEHATFIDTARNASVTTRAGLLAKEDSVTVNLLATSFGYVCVQRDKHFTLSTATVTDSTPAYDSSTPQSSEGDIVFARAFTPQRSDSVIRITAFLTGDLNSGSGNVVMALFKDAAASAVAADAFYCANNAVAFQGLLFHDEAAVSTAARTYRIRCGSAGGNFRVNVASLGGVRKSYLLIEEWVQK